MMGIGSVTNYMMNIILGAFTSTAVAVYGVYFKIQSFFFMPVFGINNGLIPIIGYNYGAGKKERIYRTIRYGILYATCFMLLGFAAFQLIPEALLGIFNQPQLSLRRVLHCGRLRLPGSGPQHLFPLCIDPQADTCPDPLRVASQQNRGREHGVVGFPDRRNHFPDRKFLFSPFRP